MISACDRGVFRLQSTSLSAAFFGAQERMSAENISSHTN
jgi:hypothetical protein